MRILVTGAAGFLGQHIAEELRDHEVVGFDRQLGRQELTAPRLFVDRLDDFDPHVVIHLAALVGRWAGEKEPLRTVEQNAAVTAMVAKECGERDIRLLYASTSEVYGDQGTRLCTERSPLKLPHNLYGLSKRWGEEAVKLYAPRHVLLRFSMPYGPGHPPGIGRAALTNFIWEAMHDRPITVHRGSERCWCWVGDTARAVRMVLDDTDSNGGWVFNVGRDDNATSMEEVARLACDAAGASYDLITRVDPPARQTVVKRLSTDEIRRLGWRPEVELPEGVERLHHWLLEGDWGIPEPVILRGEG